MTLMLPVQMKFKQGLPDVVGNIDYTKLKNQLERISEIQKDLADPKEVARLNYKEQVRLQQTAGRICSYQVAFRSRTSWQGGNESHMSTRQASINEYKQADHFNELPQAVGVVAPPFNRSGRTTSA
jgi:hypothetical protein